MAIMMHNSRWRFGVILPHTKLYGGVKRFFELGEVFIRNNCEFLVFTPDGAAPTWYQGDVRTFKLSEISAYDFIAVFITEVQFVPQLAAIRSKRKILYFVRPSDDLKILKHHPEVEVFANSTNGYEIARMRYNIDAFKALGGINIHTFFPKKLELKDQTETTTILTYGRIVEKSKGTKLVVEACEQLSRKGYKIKLILFDTPVNKKAEMAISNFTAKIPFEFVVNHPVSRNVELFHRADIFVAAERKTGYSNTAAEAMASGLPVIGTSSGTKHFLLDNETGIVVARSASAIADALEMLINNFALRKRLAENGRKKIEEFSWEALAQKILSHVKEPRQNDVIKTSLWCELKYFLHRLTS
jgi:glycosyltransferase involved in cell wall biosynthesis